MLSLSAVRCPLSAVRCPLSAVRCLVFLSPVACRPSPFFWLSAVCCLLLAVGCAATPNLRSSLELEPWQEMEA